ncbi:hypothetical protein L486_06398 [Kwoniella mangroviensis CBS 10435]|uniref:Mutanase n=1 Tax=Kwoniella mangroviensis CBS 10435 TaxID=1331196 RepID=A0A1B9IM61_9TREE|nr:hypothetical protein L486_06398 [Kwoniella mangroviensis CBS 10435]
MKVTSILNLIITASLVRALNIPSLSNTTIIDKRQTTSTASSSERYVFAHFMVGFVNSYTQDDWDRDVALAVSKGIDGFALNCDGQDANAQQLQYAFTAASSSNFKLFISPDFVHYSYEDPGPVSELLKLWVTQGAYFQFDGKPFVSSFWGEGTDWVKVRENVGVDLYVCPYYYASQAAVDTPGLDGLFSWKTWPGEGQDTVVFENMTTAPDEEYLSLLAPLDKAYMAPVSPWFYSHLPASTGYAKNYHLYSDTLWPTRWQQILDLVTQYPDQVRFVEIITWNDWTESSLITPYRGTMETDGIKDWAEDFDHSAFMDMMGPFISAFKAGNALPELTENRLVWWYRPTLKAAECSGTDSVGEKPRGWDMAADSVFLAALTTGPATVTVTIGGTASSQQVDGAGVHTLAFPMSVGGVSFQMDVDGGGSASGQGAIEISDQCYRGVYNFNVLAGAAAADGTTSGTSNTGGASAPVSSAAAPSSTAGGSDDSSAESMAPDGGVATTQQSSSAYSTPSDGGVVRTQQPTSASSAPAGGAVSSTVPAQSYSTRPWGGWRTGGWGNR